VPGEVLITLARFAGQAVATAAITDVWESVRGRFARLLGRGDARKTEVADEWLAQTREELVTAGPGTVEQVKQAAAERWAGRFSDLLDEDSSLAGREHHHRVGRGDGGRGYISHSAIACPAPRTPPAASVQAARNSPTAWGRRRRREVVLACSKRNY
jgi:hypothetical protein